MYQIKTTVKSQAINDNEILMVNHESFIPISSPFDLLVH